MFLGDQQVAADVTLFLIFRRLSMHWLKKSLSKQAGKTRKMVQEKLGRFLAANVLCFGIESHLYVGNTIF